MNRIRLDRRIRFFIIGVVLALACIWAYPETVEIDTLGGPKKVIVPETYEELRDAYLDVSRMYQDEKYDHGLTLNHVDLLLKRMDMLTDLSNELMKDIEDMKKLRVIFSQSYVGLTIGKDFLYMDDPLGGYSMGLNFNIIFFEKLNVNIFYHAPSELGFGIGWRLF
jgi:hypothetical protein